MGELHPIEASALHARRERVFLVLAGIFLGSMTMLDILGEGTDMMDILGTQELQDVEWSSSNAPHSDLIGSKVLDNVLGMDPMDSHSDILSLPDPDNILVSPIFKSDVGMQETDPGKYGAPTANVQGERRGLVAFKILSARNSPDGGSYLPLLTIVIIDPSTIDFDEVTMDGSGSGGGGSGTASLVK